MNIQKKLLILNGSHSEIPLIQAGKKLGYYVITTGNAPHLIGHKYSDEYHFADFSDINEILALAEKLEIDAICSSANDYGIITASYVSEKMSLPGHDPYDITLKLHRKDKFKEFALKNNITTPKARWYDDVDEAMKDIDQYDYPLISKPVDLTGGKGVKKIFTKDEYKDSVIESFSVSRVKKIVIEEFIEGTQHSFSTFVHNGKVVFYFSDNEFSYLNPYLVSTSAAPAENIEKVKDALIFESDKIINLLNLKDGIFHIQYIYNNGRAFILEITRRCSGDLYSYPVNKSTGLDWGEWIVKAETGMDCSDFPKIKQEGYCGRHCIMSPKNGIVKDVIIEDSIRDNIYDSVLWWNKGDIIENNMVEKLGVIFMKYDSFKEMMDKTKHINELVRVIIE